MCCSSYVFKESPESGRRRRRRRERPTQGSTPHCRLVLFRPEKEEHGKGEKKKECLPHPNPLKITVLAVGRRVDEPFAEGNKEALEALALENVLGN